MSKMETILDKKYLYLKNSSISESAGEGAYASRNVPKNTVVITFGGYMFDEEQQLIHNKHLKEKAKEYNWARGQIEEENLWKYKIQ